MFSAPNDLKPYVDAYRRKAQMQDSQMWQMGIYIQRAVGVAVAACLVGKKSKAKYFDEPLSTIAEKNEKQEEYYRKHGTEKGIEDFKIFAEIFNANFERKHGAGED